MDKYINEKNILRYSKFTGRYFNIFNTVRILNTTQATYYIENGVFPLDIYASKDKNERSVLEFLFSREDTQELYNTWCARVGQKKE